jgi:hypothetical protein
MSSERRHQQAQHSESIVPSKSWDGSSGVGQTDHHARDFLAMVSTQLTDFLKIIPFMDDAGRDRATYSTRLYEYVSSQAKLAETLLDTCGAQENRAWFFLRELVATIRSVSTVLYQLGYLEIRITSFEALQGETQDFQGVTANIRATFDRLLQKAFVHVDREARNLGLTIPATGLKRENFPLFQSPGKLQADLRDDDVRQEDDAIVKIATSYLEIAEEYTTLGFNRVFSPQELLEMVPDHVNEERLRIFEAQVHNLQAVYDTHIHYTTMEANDPRLLRLRGCISIALHLLEIATELVHFHERHERNSRHADIYKLLQDMIGTYQILDVMGNYALFYCTQFLQTGKQLSEETVMDYAQITSKRIPIPMYRGFHVRPSAYIAKIVHHYGADVHMHLGNEVYDAGNVFELFRANEEINMEKRRLIAKKLFSLQGITAIPREILPQILKQQIHELVDDNLIAVHQEILPDDLDITGVEKDDLTPEDVRGAINQVIARLLAAGKIDIIMSVSVTFIGDRRPLQDIEILAQSGYGEDECGNNIPLPSEIAYLYK